MEEQLLAVAAAAAGGPCGMEREEPRWLLFYITVVGVLEMEGVRVCRSAGCWEGASQSSLVRSVAIVSARARRNISLLP